jgi:hypothetical protein
MNWQDAADVRTDDKSHPPSGPTRSIPFGRGRSGPAVQGIVLGAGDRLFYEVKVKVKQFLGSRAIERAGLRN